MDEDGLFKRWSQRTGTPAMRALRGKIGGKTTQPTQSSRSHLSPPNEGSNAPEKEHSDDDAEVWNEDFLTKMIRQTATQNEAILSILKTYKEIAMKNKKKKTQ
ncbi:hypothetical protein Q3G72_034929 [Acer saccharum]|nr:hypothetical protein Q3G72_034929 [Acer saccharum]